MEPDGGQLVLVGCSPAPLASYLKALAVLRLVGTAMPGVRGAWRGDHLVLEGGGLDAARLIDYFLDAYVPTPAVSPWNGGSGFHPKDQQQYLNTIEASALPRFEPYRRAIRTARCVLEELDQGGKPDKEIKPILLRRLRATLPDEALPWLDACMVLTSDAPNYMPLLGSGGNDGRLDFSNNFMQQLQALDPSRRRQSAANLNQALFAHASDPLAYSDASLGQFFPGAVGGPGNSSAGYDGAATVNPWDYILTMEGTIAFAGSVARRLRSQAGGRLAAFPFTVDVSPVGSLADADAAQARAEVWLPLWDRPASWREMQFLLAEGRAQWGRRQARSGMEFAEAVVNLGVDRGIQAFARTGLLKRNGRSFLAVNLARVPVRSFPGADVLQDPEYGGWVERFQDAATRKEAPATWRSAWRTLESAIYQACAIPAEDSDRTRRLQRVLAALGAAEHVVAAARERRGLRPLRLRADWLTACAVSGAGGAEWRLAVAIAGIQAARGVSGLRAHLEPVRPASRGGWEWDDRSKSVAWETDLPLFRNLEAVLSRRLRVTREAGLARMPLLSQYPAKVVDVHALLNGRLDEALLAELLVAVALIRHEDAPFRREPGEEPPSDLCRAYVLMKQAFWPWPVDRNVSVLPPADLLPRLRARDAAGAARSAARHLRAHRLRLRLPGPDPGWVVPPDVVARIPAALLVPLAPSRRLQSLVLYLSDPPGPGRDEAQPGPMR